MRRRRPLGAGLAGTLAVLALYAAPAPAMDAGTVTHAAGATSATLSWGAADFGITDPRLAITRAGVSYDVAITDICQEGCILVADDAHTAPGDSVLKVADLDADGEPEVLVDTFSGGAHCCVTTRVLTFDGSAYTPTDIFWGDVGYRLRDADGDGRPELVGADPRFSGAFTAFAASGFPAQVLQVTHGAVADVTRRFPAVVAADARRQLRDLRRLRRGDDVRGLLAAYVADEYSLGRAATARAELAHQLRRHRIRPQYRALLLRRLKAWGYR
ncbi:hypothetical protein FSW04_22220 [Baekduia soli]|uniref:VCBS repeat-containing protein n=1 Tax=Baekduia soli TaxID=496014 RepID=A0A5B8UA32_9ACTN|nr:hypothetical protein [Baekduia soli]QEC50016.1 hypothetical protein FSW04_22220 [Baekduia soli]